MQGEVKGWIDTNYKQWSNGSKRSHTFTVQGPAHDLTVAVESQIRPVDDYFEIITRVHRD